MVCPRGKIVRETVGLLWITDNTYLCARRVSEPRTRSYSAVNVGIGSFIDLFYSAKS